MLNSAEARITHCIILLQTAILLYQPGQGHPIFLTPVMRMRIKAYPLDEKIINHVYGGFLENKFQLSGLTVTPGVRSDYLQRTERQLLIRDSWQVINSIPNTTLAAAGGHYSYFPQVNPFFFNENPDLAAIGNDKIKSEKAWHSSIGLEQEIGLF